MCGVDVPNAVPFTSILNIDIERELGASYCKKRLHVSCRPSQLTGRSLLELGIGHPWAEQRLLLQRPPVCSSGAVVSAAAV